MKLKLPKANHRLSKRFTLPAVLYTLNAVRYTLHHSVPLLLCPCEPLHQPFLTNKPNFQADKMNVRSFITEDYEENEGRSYEKTNPIQSQFWPIIRPGKPKQTQNKPNFIKSFLNPDKFARGQSGFFIREILSCTSSTPGEVYHLPPALERTPCVSIISHHASRKRHFAFIYHDAARIIKVVSLLFSSPRRKHEPSPCLYREKTVFYQW